MQPFLLPKIAFQEPVAVSPIIDLYKRLIRHKSLFFIVTLCVVSISTCLVLSLPTFYTSTAAISILPMTPDPLDTSSSAEAGPRDDDVSTHALLLVSRDLATEIVEKLALDATPRPANFLKKWACHYQAVASFFGPRCLTSPAPSVATRVTAFLKMLKATAVPRSRLIELSFTDSDPDRAAQVLNVLIETYQKQQLARRADQLTRTSNWVSQRAEELRRTWLEAEAKAGNYRAQSGLTTTGQRNGDSPLIMQQISSAAASLSAAQADLAAAQSRWDTLNTAANAHDKTVFIAMRDEPVLTALANQLSLLRAKRAELSSSFGKTYPEVSGVELQIAIVEQQISSEEMRALHSLQATLTAKQAAVDNIRNTLDRLKNDADRLSGKRVDLSTLEFEATSAKEVFESFLARAKQLDNRSSLLQSQIQIAAHATVPETPSFPDTGRYLLGSLFFGLLCGTGAALARDHLSNGFYNVSQIGRQLALPLLAVIPELGRSQRRRLSYHVMDHPFSAAAESVRGLATQIQLSARAEDACSVVIASATGQEGKTTVSLWLASVVAASGQKVLLIDADHRRGMVSRRLGGHSGAGFSDLVFGGKTAPDVIQRDTQQKFDFIGAGSALAHPFGRNEITRLRSLLRTFEKHYDLVIIDTPPLLAINDALFYASLASSTVFLCRWKRTSRQAVMTCLDRLRGVEAKLMGILLSMVDQNRLPDFSDDYSRYDIKVMKQYYIGSRS